MLRFELIGGGTNEMIAAYWQVIGNPPTVESKSAEEREVIIVKGSSAAAD